MFDMLRKVSAVNKRLKAAERQVKPSSASTVGNSLVDDAPFGVADKAIYQATAPAGLNQSTDIGTEWVNSATDAVQWWDGKNWRTSTVPRTNPYNLAALGFLAYDQGFSTFSVKNVASAPASPSIGDIWRNSSTGVYQRREATNTWVTITDTQAIAWLDGTQVRTYTVFMQNGAPTTTNDGDYWFETDANWLWKVWSSSSWNVLPRVNDDTDSNTTTTGQTFQTAAFGQRMKMAADLAGGVIKFWTGDSSETGAGWINPATDAGGPYVEYASPQTAPGNRCLLRLYPGSGGAVLYAGDFYIRTGQLNVTGLSNLNDDTAIQGKLDVLNGITCNKVTASNGVLSLNPGASTAAANVRWNASGTGEYLVNTSLSKFKLHKQPLSVDAVRGILNLTPQTWFDRQEWLDNGRSTKGLHRIPGLIAEDVEKHCPELAVYDAEHNLQSVSYDRVAALLIPIIREQQDTIETLVARVAALEERVGK